METSERRPRRPVSSSTHSILGVDEPQATILGQLLQSAAAVTPEPVVSLADGGSNERPVEKRYGLLYE